VSFAPLSSEASTVLLWLRGEDVGSFQRITLALEPPQPLARLEAVFGESPQAQCFSMAMDTSVLECRFGKTVEGRLASVQVRREWSPGARDTSVRTLTLDAIPHRTEFAPKSRLPSGPGANALEPTSEDSGPSWLLWGLAGAMALGGLTVVGFWALRGPAKARGLKIFSQLVPRLVLHVFFAGLLGGVGTFVSFFVVHTTNRESIAGAVLPVLHAFTGALLGFAGAALAIPLWVFGHRVLARTASVVVLLLAALQFEVLALLGKV
jgi:hypothetical protein